VSLRNEIKREFDVPIRLRAGGFGVLDVLVNGEKIYSKRETGRVPTADEVINLIRSKLPVK
jgi:predicted Rdx family selenoprotein